MLPLAGSIGQVSLTLAQPAVYEFVVQGAVSEKLADRLGGLRFRSGSGAHGAAKTTLTGRLQDQAQLIGVLNALYEMRLPILRVEVKRIG